LGRPRIRQRGSENRKHVLQLLDYLLHEKKLPANVRLPGTNARLVDFVALHHMAIHSYGDSAMINVGFKNLWARTRILSGLSKICDMLERRVPDEPGLNCVIQRLLAVRKDGNTHVTRGSLAAVLKLTAILMTRRSHAFSTLWVRAMMVR